MKSFLNGVSECAAAAAAVRSVMFDPNLMKTPTRAGGFFPPTPPSSTLSPDSPGWTSLWAEKVLDLASPSTPERRTPGSTSSLALSNNNNLNDSGKRGRPRADVISHLILEGSSSPSGIKCRVCSRVFPREKSLQAHLRTHTGERPYNCDYPGCNRAFTQSGQLKTHQRLHAGEKPFICSSPGCNNRYTHANRTCPIHPYHKPQRSSDLVLQPVLSGSENSDAVLLWLDNYRRDRQEKTPGKNVSLEAAGTPSPQCLLPPPFAKEEQSSPLLLLQKQHPYSEEALKKATKRGLELDIENAPHNASTPTKKSTILEERLGSPRKTLGDITKSNVVRGSPLSKPSATPAGGLHHTSSSFKLKKRWLKEAFLEEEEEQRRVAAASATETVEELALPIRWTSEDEPQRRSPKSMVVANALVELSSLPPSNLELQSDPQPLNLSLNSSDSGYV